LLPAIATIVVPGTIELVTRSVRIGWGLPFPASLVPPILGACLIAAGLVLLGWTTLLFATIGQGTLAPWDATRRLVARGVYRHVRNPMISGVFSVVLGEAALLGSLPVLYWSVLFFLANMLYIPLIEERDLERRFGEDYRLYRQHVPRWVPRVTPWQANLEAGLHEGP